MNMSRVLSVAGVLGALAVSGYGHEVSAQAGLTIGGSRANFGKKRLRPGFVPDPARVRIRSGGSIDARGLNLGAGCVGFVTQRPDYIVNLAGTSSNLRFYVVAEADTTLLVNTASGGWSCNDDSNGGHNPMVDVPNAGPGQYDIWVGSYRSGEIAPGTLFITELSSNHP